MNERIRELAEQSGLKVVTMLDESSRDVDCFLTKEESVPSVNNLEKFAQLIVRECIDTVLDSSVEYCTRPQIASEIKEHFGVEE